jgi:hypothetical protein
MLVNEDPLDPPVIEDYESKIVSKLADNFISTQLILRMNIPSANICSHHDTANIAKFRLSAMTFQTEENLANGIVQKLFPLPLADIGNQPTLRSVYRRFSVQI